jgi:hypothetical protein
MAREARRTFISVPHRFFPIEHHTAIPFVHWRCNVPNSVRAHTKAEVGARASAEAVSRWRLASIVSEGFPYRRIGYAGQFQSVLVIK